MFNPLSIMKAMSGRHEFQKNHSDLLPFLEKALRENAVEGTVLTIMIKSPEGKIEEKEIEFKKSDLPFIKEMAALLRGR